MNNAQDRVTIITGGASGIGRMTALHLARRGHRVVVVDRDQSSLNSLLEELGGFAEGDSGVGLNLDVCVEHDMEQMREQTLLQYGRIDNLVAAAGILRLGRRLKTIEMTTLDEWKTILDVNLTGTFLANRAVLPVMLKQKTGDIVNISSTSGNQGRAFDGPYCATKFGIIGMSESLAEEVASQGIRVQTLSPDAVDTPLWDQNDTVAPKPPHLISPERVAECIQYLLDLPRDVFLRNPVLMPAKKRKVKRAKAKE